jgi:hypothetical protein
MTQFLHEPVVRGIISGIAAAAVVDFHAFMSWHEFADVKKYAWGTAAFRWLQGAIMGAITGAGFSAFF